MVADILSMAGMRCVITVAKVRRFPEISMCVIAVFASIFTEGGREDMNFRFSSGFVRGYISAYQLDMSDFVVRRLQVRKIADCELLLKATQRRV